MTRKEAKGRLEFVLSTCDNKNTSYAEALKVAISALSAEPIRPKGEWEHWKGEKFFDVPVCSNCGMTFSINARGWSFCPNCGCQMNGKEKAYE